MHRRTPTSIHLAGLAILAAAMSAVTGCDRNPSPTSATAEAAEAAEAAEEGGGEKSDEADGDETNDVPYSPFGVRLADGSTFELISFKDVGLKTSPSTSRKLLFEAVAQAIAYQLKVDDQFQLRPRVVYDETLADPNNHTYCEKNRLYVDIWHGTSPERWGYSLWSGCSEAHQFAWNEIEDEAAISDDVSASAESLAKGIVESMSKAREDDCYRRAC